MKSLLVVGAGRHGRVVAETAVSTKLYEVTGFADDEPASHGQALGRWKILGHWRETAADEYIVGIGSNATRRRVFEELVRSCKQVATVVSDRASVSDSAQLGRGTVVLAGAVVQSGATIGENVIINAGAVVDHDAVIGAHAHVGPHSTVGSYARILPGETVPAAASRLREGHSGPPISTGESAADNLPLTGGSADVRDPERRPLPPIEGAEMADGEDHHVRLSVPHMSSLELGFVAEAFETNWLSTVGPNLQALEKCLEERFGVPAVALINGTAALHLAVRLAGIRPGEEVISPTLTFAASCNPICYEGGRPVLIDSERGSWNLDPNLLAEFLQRRAAVKRLPRALIAVHLFGQSADLDAILALCRQYEVQVIEDAAECLGARYKGHPPGTLGDVGIYSFNGNKIITGTSGGALVSRNPAWVHRARFWSTQACDPDPLGLKNYVHSELGYNYRLSNVLAGIVRGQLEVLEERVRQRRAVFDRYCCGFAGLPGIEPQPEADFGCPEDLATGRTRHTRWLSCFLIEKQRFGLSSAELIRALAAANIEARPVWKPMHTQPLYRGFECIGGEVAEDLNRRGICLPSSSSLSEEDQHRVIETVRAAHERVVTSCRGG
ncbi:MAG: DegT/DnrJ/EryC1/StrS family aminotransferase [Verrucomicrobiales bacterium]|nr:DegT/DnrJ/EryC1/StrS family aminotransferase [Verrucomicrobiales bacterium]